MMRYIGVTYFIKVNYVEQEIFTYKRVEMRHL